MNRASMLRSAWLGTILVGIVAIALLRREAQAATHEYVPAMRGAGVRLVTLRNGKQGLADAGGHVVPLADYRHIASGTTVADDLLLHLAEPERIAALTEYGKSTALEKQLYGDRPTLRSQHRIEQLKELGVDLLILNHLGAPAELARVREAGIEVFDLGEMRGLATLLPNMEAVAALLGDRERGVQLAERLKRRMHAVGSHIPKAQRKRALYVSAYGGQLFTGATRSSYNDVIEAAGLIDAAEGKFRDYAQVDPEQLLELDPDFVITQVTSRPTLCRISGLDRLRACANGAQGVLGVDDALIGDPGLGMLEAAERVHDLAYGQR